MARVTVRFGAKEWQLWNVHNYELSNADRSRVGVALREAVRRGVEEPFGFLALVMGDYNFLEAGETPHHAAGEVAALREGDPAGTAFWRQILGELCELRQPSLTHFWKRSMTLSRLDRCYATMPLHVMRSMRVEAATICDPELMHATQTV